MLGGGAFRATLPHLEHTVGHDPEAGEGLVALDFLLAHHVLHALGEELAILDLLELGFEVGRRWGELVRDGPVHLREGTRQVEVTPLREGPRQIPCPLICLLIAPLLDPLGRRFPRDHQPGHEGPVRWRGRRVEPDIRLDDLADFARRVFDLGEDLEVDVAQVSDRRLDVRGDLEVVEDIAQVGVQEHDPRRHLRSGWRIGQKRHAVPRCKTDATPTRAYEQP